MKRRFGFLLLILGVVGCGDSPSKMYHDAFQVKSELTDQLMRIVDEESAKKIFPQAIAKFKKRNEQISQRFQKWKQENPPQSIFNRIRRSLEQNRQADLDKDDEVKAMVGVVTDYVRFSEQKLINDLRFQRERERLSRLGDLLLARRLDELLDQQGVKNPSIDHKEACPELFKANNALASFQDVDLNLLTGDAMVLGFFQQAANMARLDALEKNLVALQPPEMPKNLQTQIVPAVSPPINRKAITFYSPRRRPLERSAKSFYLTPYEQDLSVNLINISNFVGTTAPEGAAQRVVISLQPLAGKPVPGQGNLAEVYSTEKPESQVFLEQIRWVGSFDADLALPKVREDDPLVSTPVQVDMWVGYTQK